VLIAARAQGACRYLDGTIKKPTITLDTKSGEAEWSSKSPSLEEWEERDAWTLGLIIYNTKNPVGLGIKMDGMAAEAWKALTDNYGIFSKIAAMNAEKRLCATEFMDGMDFLKHVKDLREKWKSATKKGANIDNKNFRTILIASLPESWNAIVAGVYSKTESKDVIAALTTHWDQLVLQQQKAGVLVMALQAQTKPKLVCVNLNCKCTGHAIENCYWKGGGKEGQFPPNFRNRGKMTKTPSTETNPHSKYSSLRYTTGTNTPSYHLCPICNNPKREECIWKNQTDRRLQSTEYQHPNICRLWSDRSLLR
ncbi:hypothetical protein J132_03295, partial [Termitomyces sp. J132]